MLVKMRSLNTEGKFPIQGNAKLREKGFEVLQGVLGGQQEKATDGAIIGLSRSPARRQSQFLYIYTKYP